MNCPVCGDALREIEKFQVRIDICPGCKGVWLDRGELEKVVELAGAQAPAFEPQPEPRGARYPQDPRDPRSEAPYYGERHADPHKDHKRHKRGGMLGELFEIFD